MKNVNFRDAADVGQRLPAGAYICKIVTVTDVPKDEYLKIEYDIAFGPHTNYFSSTNQQIGFWAGNFIKSYKDSALSFFKAFVTSVEKSNPGYTFSCEHEKTLVGKWIGLVLGEEEYLNKKGEVKTRLYVHQVRTGESIKKSDFEIPALKKLSDKQLSSDNNSNSFANTNVKIDIDDLPF